ncbi:RNA-binding S4 domain-containing protein [Sandarakinorhabdus sp.]|uniref:RNA-binding S4 domain-containing protein n=1 Tax=Sandarakinorhabdus sp. TaxID=1916663 RepID=UPI00286E836F|nr:RNA-binding S4 domain-containing protein [Sandarakinorhabdus sp.]
MVFGAGLRLDKWLWFARLAKSRSQAQDLCESRRLRIDGRVVERASALVRAGAVISYPRGDDIVVVRVEGVADRRGPYAEALQLYTDLTPLLRGGPPAMTGMNAAGH